MARKLHPQPVATTPSPPDSLSLALTAARTAAENRGQDLQVLDTRAITSEFDYIVIATGTSRRQLRAMSEEIDHALEADLGAYRDLDWKRPRPEDVMDHHDGPIEISAHPVHFINEHYSWHAIMVSLSPHGLGLGLDSSDSVEYCYCAVQHAQRPLDLDSEINMAGSVDEIDSMITPIAGCRRRGDSNATLLLYVHPIHVSSAVVYLTHLVFPAGVVQDALARRGLSGINVRHDADVSRPFLGPRPVHDSRSTHPLSGETCGCQNARLERQPSS